MDKRTQTLDRGRSEKSVWGVRITKNIRETPKKWKDAEECLTQSVKHGGGNVMVWGCFGGGKVGDLYRVKRELEGRLSLHTIPSGQHLIGANFLLQQDNDPKHSSKLCNTYLGKKLSAGIVSIMEWPVTGCQPYWAGVGAAWRYGT